MNDLTSVDQWNRTEGLLEGEGGAVPKDGDERLSHWTAEWVLRVLVAPRRVQASYHEEEALQRFARSQSEGVR